MAYGTVKVDNITFTNAGIDQTITVSGIVASISGNITATGTIQGQTIIGTSTVSGASVTGDAGLFTTLTGSSAGFTTLTGSTVTGTTANFNNGTFTSQISGTTVTGNLAQFTTLTGGAAGFTSITGTTVTGTTANFVTVSGTTVTGNAGQFTTITGGSAGFTSITGATVTGTVANFGAGSAAAPAVSVGTTDNGIYSPGADQLALSTNGTGRLFVDASGNVVAGGTGATSFNSGTGIQVQRDGTACVRVFNNTGNKAGELYADANSVRLDSRGANGYLTFDIGGNEAMRITNGRLVGIGTSAPGSLLHLNQSSIGTYFQANASDSIRPLTITSSTTTNTGDTHIFNVSSITGRLGLATNGSTALFIDNSQRVGIGTTSPVDIFSVRDNSKTSTSVGANIIARFASNALGADTSIALTDGTSFATQFGQISGNLYWMTGSTERARIDSSGRLLVGTSSARDNFDIGTTTIAPQFQIEGTTPAAASISVVRNSAISDASARICLAKTRGASVGLNTSVASGDVLGELLFNGADGTNLIEAASIKAQVDGTPGANDMPGRLVFSTTADGAASPTERMRIDNSGFISLGGDTNTGFSNPSENNLAITTGGSERARIDSSGRLLVGTSTAPSADLSASLQIVGTSGAGSGKDGRIVLANTATTVNASTNVDLGMIRFFSNAGSVYEEGARIACAADAGQGSGDKPSRLVFSVTADGASSPTEALRISNNRAITVSDGGNIVLGTGTGTKIGTSTSQKIGFFNETPIVQPTTGIAEAAFVENSGGTAVNVDSTFGGYTIQQVVQALQNLGLLA